MGGDNSMAPDIFLGNFDGYEKISGSYCFRESNDNPATYTCSVGLELRRASSCEP